MANVNTNLRAVPLVLSALVLVACSSGEQTSASTRVAIPASNVAVLTAETTTTVAGGAVVQPPTSVGGGATPATALPTTAASTTTTTSTVPAGAQVVTITQGGFNTKASGSCGVGMCKYVDIQSSGWKKGETLLVTCHSNVGSSGPYTKLADGSGNLHATTACFFGNVNDVYVDINGVESNVVSPWKNW